MLFGRLIRDVLIEEAEVRVTPSLPYERHAASKGLIANERALIARIINKIGIEVDPGW